MKTQRGKYYEDLTRAAFVATVARYTLCHVDLGTGDGRFVRQMARIQPDRLVVGVDACREQLWDASHRAPQNALYVIANAENLPDELAGVASSVTINFPWGSLLRGLITADSPVIEQLVALVRPGAALDVVLNAGALAEAGYALEVGASQVRRVLAQAGFAMAPPLELGAAALRTLPTTWAKRLAFGRDPRAMGLSGRWSARQGIRVAGVHGRQADRPIR